MKKAIFTLSILILFTIFCFCAFEDIPSTGLSRGLGGALSSRLEGSESVFYNPAGMFTKEKFSLTLSYGHPYQISDLNRSVFCLTFKQGRFNFGLGFNQISLAGIYSELKIVTGISFRHQRLFLGASVNYYSISISGIDYSEEVSGLPELRSKSTGTTFSAGGVYLLTENLNISFTVYDLGEASFSHSSGVAGDETELPMQISAGSLYNLRDFVFFSAELRNSLDDFGFIDRSLRVGVEFIFYEAVAFRLGNYAGDTTFGFGISGKKFSLDFGLISNPALGNSYVYSVNLRF